VAVVAHRSASLAVCDTHRVRAPFPRGTDRIRTRLRLCGEPSWGGTRLHQAKVRLSRGGHKGQLFRCVTRPPSADALVKAWLETVGYTENCSTIPTEVIQDTLRSVCHSVLTSMISWLTCLGGGQRPAGSWRHQHDSKCSASRAFRQCRDCHSHVGLTCPRKRRTRMIINAVDVRAGVLDYSFPPRRRPHTGIRPF
jgi:hypothetical protein